MLNYQRVRVDALPNMACCFQQIPLRDGGLLLDTKQDLLNKNWATKFRVVM
jgi:hypothetical protein